MRELGGGNGGELAGSAVQHGFAFAGWDVEMTDSEDIGERFWSLAQKPTEEDRREQIFLDDVIHKAHLECEIESRLAAVKTVLDVGRALVVSRYAWGLVAWTSRILTFLAACSSRRAVTAADVGLTKRLTFRQGRLADLGEHTFRQFDLVICSGAGLLCLPNHAGVLGHRGKG